ncbi:MAG TPA: PilZ domain-containing protein [Pseudobdellovibrionaceae bacterium]|nr:PilZ domain-containing protein [Pseudobdellovibrionaceae bacterium]
MTAHRYTTSEVAHIEIYGRLGQLVSRMKNLSMTGALLELKAGTQVPKKGDLIRATIHLHSIGKTRILDAEVIWTNGLGFGVSFLKKPELLARMFSKNSSSSAAKAG